MAALAAVDSFKELEMNQTDIRRIILSQPWVERGGEMVAVPAQPLTINPATICTGVGAITENEYQTAVIKLSNLCQLPMRKVRIVERFRRVYLMEFLPHRSYDPVLPMATIALGEGHDNAYRLLVNQLSGWREDDWNQRQWFTQSKGYVRTCVKAAVQSLRADEAEYYARQMMYSLANPDRRSLL